MKSYDIAILTDKKHEGSSTSDSFSHHALVEDTILIDALERKGFTVIRVDWANRDFDWSTTKCAIFRSTWDYSERFEEFIKWCELIKSKTILINSYSLIFWNANKFYLQELQTKGVNIPDSVFIESGRNTTLEEIHHQYGWSHTILKPAISAGARHTYQLKRPQLSAYEGIFQELIQEEPMLLQPFLTNISTRGELSLMMINAQYTHAVIKKAKKGDFRVQDNFGGSVAIHKATKEEILFAQQVIDACDELPVYARVDIVWDNDGQLALSELELIEPELWFRLCPEAADKLAEAIALQVHDLTE